jgi:hypothetical protein
LVILPVRQVGADEVPVGRCSISASFDNVQTYLDGQMKGILDQFGVGSYVTYGGAFLELDDSEPPQPDPDSSNDDLLKLTLKLDTLIGEKHFYAKF